MAIEIERKFLVVSDAWRAGVTGSHHFRQGYLSSNSAATVRVRVMGEDRAVLTLKGAARGLVRAEYEYDIPVADALELLEMAEPHVVVKHRYYVPFGGLIWEVDVFGGRHAGLVVAEVELDHAEQAVALPGWIGAEVSHDDRYNNASLSRSSVTPES